MQVFVANTILNFSTVNIFEQKCPTSSSAPDEAFLILVPDLIKEPKSFDIGRGLVLLSDTTFENGSPMQLSVVVAYRFDLVYLFLLLNIFTAVLETTPTLRDSQSVIGMAFLQLQKFVAGVFGFIAMGLPDGYNQLSVKAADQSFAHDAHESSISG